MKIGDIHWVELPSAGGREQSGRRPGGSIPKGSRVAWKDVPTSEQEWDRLSSLSFAGISPRVVLALHF